MTVDDFQLLHLDQQVKVINSTPLAKMPMWMERLKTALYKNSPNALAFLDERLIHIYKNLKTVA